MTAGLAPGVAQSILNALCRNAPWTQPPAFFIKLHTADPGPTGAAAAFGDTTRQPATFAAAQADGTITNSAPVSWTNLTAAGELTHVSFWSAATGGTFLGSDDLVVPSAVQAGDNYTIAAGDVDLSIAPIAA